MKRYYLIDKEYGFGQILVDAETGIELGSDHGEPEDQSFLRDWSWVPKELNSLNDEITIYRSVLEDLESKKFLECVSDPPCEECTVCNAKNALKSLNKDIFKSTLKSNDAKLELEAANRACKEVLGVDNNNLLESINQLIKLCDDAGARVSVEKDKQSQLYEALDSWRTWAQKFISVEDSLAIHTDKAMMNAVYEKITSAENLISNLMTAQLKSKKDKKDKNNSIASKTNKNSLSLEDRVAELEKKVYSLEGKHIKLK